jgi:DNA-binding transcriptional LysR family regulator
MDRVQRLAGLWNWLPAFQAVAEVEHIHRAARMLHTSPSAVSRTIRLLEDRLGAALFVRSAGRLHLTPLGRELLTQTREAMVAIDAAVAPLDGEAPMGGDVRVSSQGRLTTVFLLPALARLRQRNKDIVPHLLCVARSEVGVQLARGQLAAAVVFQPTPRDGIRVERLGEASNGIYCGVGHPLHAVGSPSLEDVLASSFAAPEPRDDGPSVDGWPPELPRKIALYSALLDGGIEACISGELLAVFPDALVPSLPRGDSLRRLPLEIVPSTTLYGMRRERAHDAHDLGALVIEEVRSELARSSLCPAGSMAAE